VIADLDAPASDVSADAESDVALHAGGDAARERKEDRTVAGCGAYRPDMERRARLSPRDERESAKNKMITSAET
jgi:hypothetical protein